jgi:hypothetical protein
MSYDWAFLPMQSSNDLLGDATALSWPEPWLRRYLKG